MIRDVFLRRHLNTIFQNSAVFRETRLIQLNDLINLCHVILPGVTLLYIFQLRIYGCHNLRRARQDEEYKPSRGEFGCGPRDSSGVSSGD